MIRLARSAALIAALGGLGSPSTVLGFNEPDGFRGLPWGATEQQMRSAVSIVRACEDIRETERWQGHRYCFAQFLIGNVKIDASYAFRDDKFVRVGLHFASQDFENLRAVFVERYGSPTSESRDLAAWNGSATAIALHRRLGSTAKGYASLATQAELREVTRLRDELTKGAAKGL